MWHRPDLLAGIGGCTALRELNLSFCYSLESLPEGDSCYSNLTRCLLLLLDSFGEQLSVALTCLGAGIGGCTALQILKLYESKRLMSLPEGDFLILI